MTRSFEIIKTGTWLYDNQVVKPIQIVKQNWDFYHGEGYDTEPPDLNEQGEAYYAIYDSYSDIRNANRSQTCYSKEEAIALAEKKVPGEITWQT